MISRVWLINSVEQLYVQEPALLGTAPFKNLKEPLQSWRFIAVSIIQPLLEDAVTWLQNKLDKDSIRLLFS